MKSQNNETDSILENVVEAVIENMKAVSKIDQDPFEFYVHRVQLSLFLKEDIFRSRFVKGYHALLSEISKDF